MDVPVSPSRLNGSELGGRPEPMGLGLLLAREWRIVLDDALREVEWRDPALKMMIAVVGLANPALERSSFAEKEVAAALSAPTQRSPLVGAGNSDYAGRVANQDQNFWVPPFNDW